MPLVCGNHPEFTVVNTRNLSTLVLVNHTWIITWASNWSICYCGLGEFIDAEWWNSKLVGQQSPRTSMPINCLRIEARSFWVDQNSCKVDRIILSLICKLITIHIQVMSYCRCLWLLTVLCVLFCENVCDDAPSVFFYLLVLDNFERSIDNLIPNLQNWSQSILPPQSTQSCRTSL